MTAHDPAGSTSPQDPEELVDVVDEDDRVVATLPRAEVRARNLCHRGVAILVRDGRGRVHVHRRTATKDVFPSHDDMFVGGMVGAGETYLEAAVRELAEELGISGAPLVEVFRHRYDHDDNNWVGVVYEARWDGPVRLQASEIAAGAWLPLDEVAASLDAPPAVPEGRTGVPRPPFCWVPDGREIFTRWLGTRRAGG